MRQVIFTIFFLSFWQFSSGQFYNTGQAPASVKWMQIKTENFQVIYPRGFYEKANHVALVLEYMYQYTTEDLNHKPKKISIILHNKSVRSNGYVVWAPRRSEWITTPPQNSYPHEWLEQLALHEYRHVVQISKLNQGFTKVLYLLFGEMAVGAVAAYLPRWILEGDATVNETVFSATGRGRQPDFTRHLRAIELEMPERYSYDQSYQGSFKYYTPGHYAYGYQIVGYGRLKYGPDLWNHTFNTVGKKSWTFMPVFLGLRKKGAGSVINIYHETFDSLKVYWKSSLEDTNYTNTSNIPTLPTEDYTSYEFPHSTRHGIVAVRKGIDDITRFVLLTDSTETILHTPGRYYEEIITVGDKYIVWAEYIPHIRWQQENYSVLKRYDYETGKVKWLSKKSRYFSPALSPDEERVVCIEVDDQNQYYFIILDVETGEVLRRISGNKDEYLYTPVWIDKERIGFTSLDENGKKIEQLFLRSEKREILFSSEFLNIKHLDASGDLLYFAHDFEMARTIYSLHLKSGEVNKLIHTKYEADFPDADSSTGKLVFSEYTLNGFKPVYSHLDSLEGVPYDSLSRYQYAWADALSEASGNINIQNTEMPEMKYDSMRYRRWLHAFNIHSWLPFYTDFDDLTSYEPEVYLGAMLLSQNKLSTVTSSIGYYYSNDAHHFNPKITWAGLFPVFEVEALYRTTPGGWTVAEYPLPSKFENYYNFSIRSYLPLNLGRNKYYRSLRPGIEYIYENAYYAADSTHKLGINFLQYDVSFSNQLKSTARDLYPRFGQSVYLRYRFSPLDPQSFGTNILANVNLYFPGIWRHHSLRVNYGHQRLGAARYVSNPSLSLPRGYGLDKKRNYSEVLRGSAEYYFPFLYPDWSIGSLAYIKRFHASIFMDYAQVKYYENQLQTSTVQEDYLSFGFTLAAQMNYFHFLVPFIPKVTFAYKPMLSDYYVGISIDIDTSIF